MKGKKDLPVSFQGGVCNLGTGRNCWFESLEINPVVL
jgi:hypothetical protein